MRQNLQHRAFYIVDDLTILIQEPILMSNYTVFSIQIHILRLWYCGFVSP